MQSFEHVLELIQGETGTIEFRFPKDQRRWVDIKLAAADDAAGTAELVMDDMVGYDIFLSSYCGHERALTRLGTADDGDIHATLNLAIGERVDIASDNQFIHTLSLVDVSWQGRRLQLKFREQC